MALTKPLVFVSDPLNTNQRYVCELSVPKNIGRRQARAATIQSC
jgi:hypothetical protein